MIGQSEIPSITLDEAYKLCKRSEDQFFDRKSAACNGTDLQKHAVAFANADGGEIAVGLKDEKAEADHKKRWDGAKDPEFYNQHLQALFQLNPQLPFRYDFLRCDDLDGVILRIFIDKSQHVCQTTKGKYFNALAHNPFPL